MNRKILRLAIPNILSNLAIPLLSSVDTAVVGHLDKVTYLGAIAVGSMIFNFIYWAFGFLRMGTTGLTAQAFGSKDGEEISGILVRSLLVALSGAVALIFFRKWIGDLSFYLIDGTEEVEIFARQYFNIRIYAAPATLALYTFYGWFLGMQNAKYPMILAVFVNVANIIFNLVFIYQFGMRSDGVALGTVCAQYLGLMLAVVLFLRDYKVYLSNVNLKLILHFDKLKEFFRVNLDIFVRTLALVFVFTFFTAKSAEFGDELLAVNAILMQLWMILSYGVDGFAFAAESLVGNFIGAKDKRNLKSVIRYSFYWGIGLALFVSFIYLLFSEQLLVIFTDNYEIISLALTYIIYIIISPPINAVCFIWDGVYIGATATSAMRNSMLVSTILIFIPAFIFLKGGLGNHALWIAMMLFMFSRGIGLTILASGNIYKKII